MRRESQNVLLVLLGGALLKIGSNGDYLRYVKPAQQPWLLAAGAVLLALGVIAIARDVVTRRDRLTVGHSCGQAHHHANRSAWLLMLPVLAVYLIAPPALGSDSVTRTESRAPAAGSSTGFAPLPTGRVIPLSMTEFVTRAGWDPAGSLTGRTVSLTGFVTRRGDSVLLARMVITCCAADAFPVTVRLVITSPLNYPNDTWLQVTGQVVPGTASRANNYTPGLTVTSVRQIPQPRDPYEG